MSRLPAQAIARQAPSQACGRVVLDRLTEPLEEAEIDHRTGKDEESEVNVVAALVADDQPPAAGDPGQGAFHHPAVATQPLAALDPAPGDAWDDATPAAGAAATGIVVGLTWGFSRQ